MTIAAFSRMKFSGLVVALAPIGCATTPTVRTER